ncbi:OapA N-terminal domain-containing protein, partial [Vibrio sp. M260118]|uniref:OapA N-terminal domain-containing protein n=1 Tax=Vibrio sp. M260118 TaxID=3020896 RepID=UPI002F421424
MLSLFARLPWIHRALIALFSALIVIVLFLPAPNDLRQEETIYQVGKAYPLAIDIEQLALQESPARHAVLRWEKHTVGSGDSMALLFQRAGLSSRLLYQLTSSNKEIEKQLTRVRPGDSFQLGFDSNNQLIQLKRVINPFETFLITKSDDGYTSELDKKEIHYQYNYAEADITSNFWNAGVNAGLTANQIMELAGIFGWDIDFALDIRSGDKFKILYQEKVVEGEVAGRGKIIAAIFENQGD